MKAAPVPSSPAVSDAEVVVGGRHLKLTNLSKVFWPELGLTKRDLLLYYTDVAPVLLPHLAGRAMVMKRYPNGASGPFFFMKRTPSPRPPWLETCAIEHASGNVIDFPIIGDLASLLWVVNLGCIDLNPWYSRCDDVDRPDFLHFDLDPVPPARFGRVLEAACLVREALDRLKMPSFPKTTGSRGIHVYVPIRRGPLQKEVWTFAKAFARELDARHPGVLTAEYRKAKRPAGRVLVDYNQNAWGRTLASVYSVRPTPEASVSTPLRWSEIEKGVRTEDFRIDTVRNRIREVGDLWKPRGRAARTLPAGGCALTIPVTPDMEPMLAQLASEIPSGDEWVYEPKWDGFRCLAFRDGTAVDLRSKSGQPLGRYFPEIVEAVATLAPGQFVLDGEIVVPVEGQLSFDDLLQRIHPAASRVQRLASETPGLYLVFDLLVDESGQNLVPKTWRERRAALERFAARHLAADGRIRLSPATSHIADARRWLRAGGGALDGVIAKRVDEPYRPGDRSAMRKIKFLRTADCVVGGFRYASRGKLVGSLLLGLYDADGKLDHVGFCSGIATAERAALTAKLEKRVRPPGFTGRAPGGPSRWSTERSGEWQPLAPELVVEVQYDHYSQGRFRHGTRLLRWRPDKAPAQCTLDQVEREAGVSPLSLVAAGLASKPSKSPKPHRLKKRGGSSARRTSS